MAVSLMAFIQPSTSSLAASRQRGEFLLSEWETKNKADLEPPPVLKVLKWLTWALMWVAGGGVGDPRQPAASFP